MNVTIDRLPIANGVGASWFEDLSPAFLDECVSLGIAVVGCTANEAWDDTLESIENLQTVKQTVKGHERTYIIETGDDLEKGLARNDVGVILGFQNPKALSDSMNFLETFADMGLRCCAPAFRENSYYGCGFSSALDSGLSQVGERVVRVMNRRGIVIDLSHVGDNTAIDAVELSEHPVIFSHSVSRTLMEAGPKIESAGVKNSAVRRAAPDELVLAAAKKGGVICPDARIAGS
jgi:membrane dipeptidase